MRRFTRHSLIVPCRRLHALIDDVSEDAISDRFVGSGNERVQIKEVRREEARGDGERAAGW
jgi:hypothetical protein